MNEKNKIKNIYDLKHSVLVTKGGTFLALAFSSWIGILFGIKNYLESKLFIILMPTVIATGLFYLGYSYFEKCKVIYKEIEEL